MATGQKTGGRKVGTPNKSTADLKALAQPYGPAIVKRLAELSGIAIDENGRPIKGAELESTQAIAMKELLDRGFGRATQILAGDDTADPVNVSMKIKFVRPPGA